MQRKMDLSCKRKRKFISQKRLSWPMAVLSVADLNYLTESMSTKTTQGCGCRERSCEKMKEKADTSVAANMFASVPQMG